MWRADVVCWNLYALGPRACAGIRRAGAGQSARAVSRSDGQGMRAAVCGAGPRESLAGSGRVRQRRRLPALPPLTAALCKPRARGRCRSARACQRRCIPHPRPRNKANGWLVGWLSAGARACKQALGVGSELARFARRFVAALDAR